MCVCVCVCVWVFDVSTSCPSGSALWFTRHQTVCSCWRLLHRLSIQGFSLQTKKISLLPLGLTELHRFVFLINFSSRLHVVDSGAVLTHVAKRFSAEWLNVLCSSLLFTHALHICKQQSLCIYVQRSYLTPNLSFFCPKTCTRRESIPWTKLVEGNR